MYFTVESRDEAEKVLSDYKNQSKPTGEFTRGLLIKGVD
jgi:hypothetical protein